MLAQVEEEGPPLEKEKSVIFVVECRIWIDENSIMIHVTNEQLSSKESLAYYTR